MENTKEYVKITHFRSQTTLTRETSEKENPKLSPLTWSQDESSVLCSQPPPMPLLVAAGRNVMMSLKHLKNYAPFKEAEAWLSERLLNLSSASCCMLPPSLSLLPHPLQFLLSSKCDAASLLCLFGNTLQEQLSIIRYCFITCVHWWEKRKCWMWSQFKIGLH